MYGMTLTIANQTFNEHGIRFYKSGDQYIAVRGNQKFVAYRLYLLIDLILTLFLSQSTEPVVLTEAQWEAGITCWLYEPDPVLEATHAAKSN